MRLFIVYCLTNVLQCETSVYTIANKLINKHKDNNMYQVTYTSFNEYGGIVQYSIKGKAKDAQDAKRKCLNFDSAAWDLVVTAI